jgi:hypothetical protein
LRAGSGARSKHNGAAPNGKRAANSAAASARVTPRPSVSASRQAAWSASAAERTPVKTWSPNASPSSFLIVCAGRSVA